MTDYKGAAVMEFTFVTDYNQKALTTLAKVLRKTIRRASSIIFRAVTGAFIAMMLPGVLFPALLMLIEKEAMSVEVLLMGYFCIGIILLIIVVPIIFSDYLVGLSGRKYMLPGTERATVVFSAEAYTTIANAAKTEYRYDNVLYISETTDYFVFVLGRNHGLLFTKSSISGGTVEDFRRFIEERTNKKLLMIKG